MKYKVMFIGATDNSSTKEWRANSQLTKGKWYDPFVMGKPTPESTYYIIQDDRGKERMYEKEFFITVDKLRDKKLTDLGI